MIPQALLAGSYTVTLTSLLENGLRRWRSSAILRKRSEKRRDVQGTRQELKLVKDRKILK
jgi:hypothetical protein